MIGNLDSNTDLVVQWWDPERAAKAVTPAKLPRPFNSSAAQLFVLPPVCTGTSYELLTQIIRDATKGINSVLAATAIDHACARVKSFTDFGDDWDGEGARAPRSELLDASLLFLRRLQPWHPTPSATLDSLGQPVVEFHDPDTSFFGKIRFVSPRQVEMFAVSGQEESYLEGDLASMDVLRFLSDHMQITLRPS